MTTGNRFKNLKELTQHALFLALGVLAFVFFEERLFTDSSYYIFHVINSESFRIEHSRFILLFSQLPALLAVKAGMSLKIILLVYSIGHVAFFYGIFLLCRYVYNDRSAGPLLLLLQTMGIMSGFFTPMFELYYAAGLLVLFASILYNDPRKPFNIILMLLPGFFILTAHQFAFVLFLFIFVLHALEYRKTFLKQYLVFLILLIAVYFFKKYAATDYEKAKTAAFMNALHEWNFDLQYVWQLIKFLLKYYWHMIIIMSASVSLFIYQRKYLLCILFISAFTGMLVICNLSNYGFEQTRYQEQVYFPLTFIAAFPFCRYALTHSRPLLQNALYVMPVLLIVHRLALIWNNGAEFSYRTVQMKRLIKHARTLEGTKFMVCEANIYHPFTVHPNWSYPVETMLLSSMENEQHSISICTDEDMNFGENKTMLTPDKYMFRRWEIYDLNSLNSKYFRPVPGPYISLNNKGNLSDTVVVEMKALFTGYNIAENRLPRRVKTGSILKYPIQLINKSDRPFFSHPESGSYLTYHWQRDGNDFPTEVLKTLPEVDIQKTYSQDVIVKCPAETGIYTLIIDLVCRGVVVSSVPVYIDVE